MRTKRSRLEPGWLKRSLVSNLICLAQVTAFAFFARAAHAEDRHFIAVQQGQTYQTNLRQVGPGKVVVRASEGLCLRITDIDQVHHSYQVQVGDKIWNFERFKPAVTLKALREAPTSDRNLAGRLKEQADWLIPFSLVPPPSVQTLSKNDEKFQNYCNRFCQFLDAAKGIYTSLADLKIIEQSPRRGPKDVGLSKQAKENIRNFEKSFAIENDNLGSVVNTLNEFRKTGIECLSKKNELVVDPAATSYFQACADFTLKFVEFYSQARTELQLAADHINPAKQPQLLISAPSREAMLMVTLDPDSTSAVNLADIELIPLAPAFSLAAGLMADNISDDEFLVRGTALQKEPNPGYLGALTLMVLHPLSPYPGPGRRIALDAGLGLRTTGQFRGYLGMSYLFGGDTKWGITMDLAFGPVRRLSGDPATVPTTGDIPIHTNFAAGFSFGVVYRL